MRTNRHYPTRAAYLEALAEATKGEYETIVAAGLDLQLDCPDLALSRHMIFTDLSDDEAEIPDDKVLVPGVVDSTTNFVEHAELVAQHLRRFVDIVGRDRVIAGSNCGFGAFAGFGAVDIAYAKLAALVDDAARV